VTTGELYFVDAHSQVDDRVDVERVIPLMDRAGVRRVILSTTARRSQDEVLALAARHPGRVIPAVRTKGYMTNMPLRRYEQILDSQLADPRYGAMAEVLSFHEQVPGSSVQRIMVPPDDPRVERAFAAARQKGWPFVIQIQFANTGPLRESYMAKLKALTAQHPDHPVVLIHMGQLDATTVQQLIVAHPNLYFIASTATPIAAHRGGFAWTNMFEGGRLSPEWKRLLVDHRKRFIFGLDSSVAETWDDSYVEQAVLWRAALMELPEEVAHVFAHGNAERLWRLS